MVVERLPHRAHRTSGDSERCDRVRTSYVFTPRPNIVPGVPIYLYGPGYPGGKITNNSPSTAAQIASAGCVGKVAQGAFCSPPTGTQGDMARNSVRGYGALTRRVFHSPSSG